jgi:hypothetical protein
MVSSGTVIEWKYVSHPPHHPILHGVLMGAGSLCDSGHKIVISTWKEVQRKYKSNPYGDVKLTDDVTWRLEPLWMKEDLCPSTAGRVWQYLFMILVFAGQSCNVNIKKLAGSMATLVHDRTCGFFDHVDCLHLQSGLCKVRVRCMHSW